MDISAKTTPQMFDANNRLVCLILDNLIRNACVYAKKQVHIESLKSAGGTHDNDNEYAWFNCELKSGWT